MSFGNGLFGLRKATRTNFIPGALIRSLVVIAAVGVLLVACGSSNQTVDGVKVPKLVGLQNREAQSRLAAVGLRWAYSGNRDRVYSEVTAANSGSTRDGDWIAHQDPAPSRVVEHATIVLLWRAYSYPTRRPLEPVGMS